MEYDGVWQEKLWYRMRPYGAEEKFVKEYKTLPCSGDKGGIQWREVRVVLFFFFSGEPPLSYSVEKRRDPKKCAIFWGPASSQHYNSGGWFTGKKTKNHYITTNAFSYIRTEFGALRSRPLAEKHATN